MAFEPVWQTPGSRQYFHVSIDFLQSELDEGPQFSQMVIASKLKKDWTIECTVGKGQMSDPAVVRLPLVDSFPYYQPFSETEILL